MAKLSVVGFRAQAAIGVTKLVKIGAWMSAKLFYV